MSEGVIFGEDDDEDTQDDSDDSEFVTPEEVTDDGQNTLEDDLDAEEDEVEDSIDEDDSMETEQTTDDDSNEVENREEMIEENSNWKLETLGACHGGNKSIMVRRENERDGSIQETWINFSSELSEYSTEEMGDKVSELQDNKDKWGGAIKLKLFNKGTMNEPQIRFLDFEIPESVPDGFEAVPNPDDSNGSKGQSDSFDSGEDVKMGEYKIDQCIEKVEEYADESYSIDTEIKNLGAAPGENILVKAVLTIDGESVSGHGTDDDSNLNSQLLEVAETRAIKRAIKHSGALINGGDE